MRKTVAQEWYYCQLSLSSSVRETMENSGRNSGELQNPCLFSGGCSPQLSVAWGTGSGVSVSYCYVTHHPKTQSLKAIRVYYCYRITWVVLILAGPTHARVVSCGLLLRILAGTTDTTTLCLMGSLIPQQDSPSLFTQGPGKFLTKKEKCARPLNSRIRTNILSAQASHKQIQR